MAVKPEFPTIDAAFTGLEKGHSYATKDKDWVHQYAEKVQAFGTWYAIVEEDEYC